MRLFPALLLCAALVGCESDEAKLVRLQQEAEDAANLVEHYEAESDSLLSVSRFGMQTDLMVDSIQLGVWERGGRRDSADAIRERLAARERKLKEFLGSAEDSALLARHDSVQALLEDARTKATLAERELNRFLR